MVAPSKHDAEPTEESAELVANEAAMPVAYDATVHGQGEADLKGLGPYSCRLRAL